MGFHSVKLSKNQCLGFQNEDIKWRATSTSCFSRLDQLILPTKAIIMDREVIKGKIRRSHCSYVPCY